MGARTGCCGCLQTGMGEFSCPQVQVGATGDGGREGAHCPGRNGKHSRKAMLELRGSSTSRSAPCQENQSFKAGEEEEKEEEEKKEEALMRKQFHWTEKAAVN